MSLKDYNKKRDFDVTQEPSGKKAPKKTTKGHLEFVIQKHHASHLHYDLRLELFGVLKSWAVPKGPSLDPSVKRLAMQVEDHPFDYRTFEGSIPKGEYGAGKVIVWDAGTYSVPDATTIKEIEKAVEAALEKGDLKLFFHGKKVKGAFALVRMGDKDSKQWLLIKKKDEYASEEDITRNFKSVLSRRILNDEDK